MNCKNDWNTVTLVIMLCLMQESSTEAVTFFFYDVTSYHLWLEQNFPENTCVAMSSQRILNYCRARATLLCCEKDSSNFFVIFLFCFWFPFLLFCVRVFKVFDYREATIFAILSVDNLFLFFFLSYARLDRCHGTCEYCPAASLFECVEVYVLQSSAPQSAIFSFSPVTPNPFDSFLSFSNLFRRARALLVHIAPFL